MWRHLCDSKKSHVQQHMKICFELAPEIQLPNNSCANIARGDPNACFPLEAVLRRTEDHERHSNGVQVIVLVGAPWRPERIQ